MGYLLQRGERDPKWLQVRPDGSKPRESELPGHASVYAAVQTDDGRTHALVRVDEDDAIWTIGTGRRPLGPVVDGWVMVLGDDVVPLGAMREDGSASRRYRDGVLAVERRSEEPLQTVVTEFGPDGKTPIVETVTRPGWKRVTEFGPDGGTTVTEGFTNAR